jgi:hypothetical protein
VSDDLILNKKEKLKFVGSNFIFPFLEIIKNKMAQKKTGPFLFYYF